MNRKLSLLAAGLMALLAAPALAQEPLSPATEKALAKATAALARLEFTFKNEFVGTRTQIGQALCIDAANGVFLTRDVPVQIPDDELKDFRLIPVGSSETKIPATFMGTDPEENLSFLRLAPPEPGKGVQHKWEQVELVRADLRLGEPVFSVGLLGPQTGNAPYVGMARVAAKLRLPNEVVLVNSGELTNATSPVLTADGRVVGLVAGQIPMEYRMVLRDGTTDVALAGLQSTRFFVPVSEFAHVLGQIPRDGKSRKLPWLGIWQLRPLSAEEAQGRQIQGKPAVEVGQVMVGGPADQAQIKQGDTIVGLNGKPLEDLGTPALSAGNLQLLLNRLKPGDKINLTIFRGGKESDVQLTLGTLPMRPHEADRYYNVKLGIAARDLVPFDRYASRPEPLTTHGVLITVVQPNSPAAMGNVRPGDLVTSVADKPTPNVEAFGSVLKSLAGRQDTVPFMVLRSDNKEVLNVQMPKQ